MDALRQNYKKYIKLRIARKVVTLLLFVFLFDFFLFAAPVLANNAIDMANKIKATNEKIISTAANNTGIVNKDLPQVNEIKVEKVGYHVITAYTSEKGQTDNSPCITASGFNLCDHGVEDTLAANFLPLGAKVRIPDLFGDRVFTIRDRMNARYANRLDIWMQNKADAKIFGVKKVKIEVFK